MTFPLDTLAPTITAAGISAPPFADILASLEASFHQIYGSDAYFGADSQDGQWAAVFAKALSDTNDAIIASYNNFSPQTAVGEGLSSVVRINGIFRLVATKSQASVNITGAVGTTILQGQVRDQAGQLWNLPNSVTIPGGGTISVTATATDFGEIRAAAHSINIIATPVSGWNSVDNPAAATPGAPIETDAALRRRQSESVARPARSLLVAIRGALEALNGVAHVEVYENSTNTTDSDGIPSHSIAAVVAGGDNNEIADTILLYKPPGTGLFGSTTVNRSDGFHTYAVKFTIPAQVTIKVQINLSGLTGYTSDVGNAIKAALVAYFNSLPIGQNVYWSRAFKPVINLPNADKFEINTLKLFRDSDTPLQDDVVLDFDEIPVGDLAQIAITVV